MYYSPHNEYINSSAKIVLLGITPGWQQVEIAFRAAVQCLQEQKSYGEACREAKFAAGMAGPMRANLMQMLQEIGIHDYLGITSIQHLFEPGCTLLHTTSLIRFPVFVAKQNYNGHRPSLTRNPFLFGEVLESFLPEIGRLNRPLIIPLGKSVEEMLRLLIDRQLIPGQTVLWGFPHPSGANGHRLQQFYANKAAMERVVDSLMQP
ncbi:hypothetical protein HYD27_14315 [Paenibacillus sp. S150]|nr:hypothetical protein [Paenibacillus sp. S150]